MCIRDRGKTVETGDGLRMGAWIGAKVQDFHAPMTHHMGSGKMCIRDSTCIIMDTTKGKGVSYMTNSVDWHGRAPTMTSTRSQLRN